MIIIPKSNSFQLHKSLNENPDTVFDYRTIKANAEDKDAYAFFFYRGLFYPAPRASMYHYDIARDNGIPEKKTVDLGRIWTDKKIISLWKDLETIKQIKSLASELDDSYGVNILSSNWKFNITIGTAEELEYYNQYFGNNDLQIDSEVLVPFKDLYLVSGKHKQRIDHMISPMKKEKRKVPDGWGSKYKKSLKQRFQQENKHTIKQVINEEVEQLLFEKAMSELPLYPRALKFADYIHRNQIRKYSGEKYINHPLAVSFILNQWGYNTWYQAIALLHDVVEDANNVQATIKLIKKYFGNKILKIVKSLSHDKSKVNYQEYLLNLAQTDKNAFIIKTADMWSNLNDNASVKQILKYSKAIKYLVDNNIKNIPKRLLNLSNKVLSKL